MSGVRGPELVLPAALLRIWSHEAVDRHLAAEAERSGHLHLLGPGLVAVLPGPGRPAVLDRALALGQRALATEGCAPGSALLAPVRLRVGELVEPVEDEVVEVLRAGPPRMEPATVHLTSHAVHGLERRHTARPAGELSLRSGRVVPIFTAGCPEPEVPDGLHRDLLGREPRWIARPRLERELLAGLRSSGVVRVVGPLGAGKSRLVATVLEASGGRARWHNAALDSLLPPALLEDHGQDHGARRWLVVDALEAAGPELWRVLAERAANTGAGAPGWILVGRPPLAWPSELAATPLIELPAADAEFGATFSRQLFAGLGLPESLSGALLEATAGNPFALEETLVSLARERHLRKVLGGFFHRGGDHEGDLPPTARFTLQVEAEIQRLGSPTAARTLATTAIPIPEAELLAAAEATGAEPGREGWTRAYLAAGLMTKAQGPWGTGLAWSSAAIRLAVETTMAPASRGRLARKLGSVLQALGGVAERSWAAYPLLAGTKEGAHALLAASRRAGVDRAELLDALLAELRAARQARPRDPALELDLLWALMPLARRLGRLHELREMIGRAVLLAEDRNLERLLAFAALQAELDRNAGRLDDAESVLKRALIAARGSDDRRQGPLLLELARLLALRNRPGEARDLLTKTLAAAERGGRSGLAAGCRFQLGNLALAAHDIGQACELHERALATRRRAGVPAAVIQSLSALGAVAIDEGNYPAALTRLLEAREIAVVHRLEREEAYAQLGVGRVFALIGDDLAATGALRRALALREGRDDTLGEAIARLAVGANHLHLGHVDAALREARSAHFSLSLLPAIEVRADAERLLGQIAMRQRHTAEAAVHFSEAERLHRAAGDGKAVLIDLRHLLKVALALESVDDVMRAFDALLSGQAQGRHESADELLQFDLFLGARWLATRDVRAPDPQAFLESAYEELLRKTSFLDPALRQRFLFQMSEHQAIVDAATAARIPLPAL